MDSTTERPGPDGLTKTERASLRDPKTYEVMAINPCRFIISSKVAFADFDCVIGYGTWVRMTSNTGTRLEMTIGEECPCLDNLHREGRCKHTAVLEAVLEYRAAMGAAEFLAQKKVLG